MTENFAKNMKALPIGNVEKAEALFADLSNKVSNLGGNESASQLIKSVLVNAPFVRDCLFSDPDLVSAILDTSKGNEVHQLIKQTERLADEVSNEKELMRELRIMKGKMALFLALADLGQVWQCAQVTRALSDFADAALLSAVRFSLREEEKRGKITLANQETPETGSGIVIFAMGKHGACELNYSSDIDLVVFYDALRLRCADRHERQPAMVRVVKRIVKLMQERTENGYVFRTDLRLRPDPGSTAVAISTEAALNYYESLGQNWERAAFIKARPVACDLEAASEFLSELSPFVWRKYMDFATIADVHAMKRQTHLHKGHGKIAIRGHNVKLGRGGIREIEFFVQTQQLIAGGRNPELRKRGTCEMLVLLARAGWIDHSAAALLEEHYIFLRNVEHRIQMRHDEQTHLLPEADEAFTSISYLMGYDEVGDFEDALCNCFESVTGHYGRLFEEEKTLSMREGSLVFTGDDDDPETLETLMKLGFVNVSQISNTIRGWHMGRYKAMRSERAREALTMILPKLLRALSSTAKPESALFAFDDFLKQLPAGVQLFSLLRANDHLLDLIAQLMGSAPRLSDTIARRPHVFDALLEPAFFGCVPDQEQLRDQLQMTLREAVDYQDVLDRVRVFTQEQQFLVGTRLLSGTITTNESQRLYADLADVVVELLLSAVLREVSNNHGDVPGGDITVLAMGKLGGKEMTPSSDLDLILIYETPEDVKQSDGRRPLAVTQYYSRVTQRFIAALSAPTGEGVAYEVDMRLRPSGKAGPLATDINAFRKYQEESAWTWEHMALTRARTIGGNNALRQRVNDVVHAVLIKPRDQGKLRADVAEMNERLHNAKESVSIWGIKETPGGLVDVEFLAQYYQLLFATHVEAVLSTNTIVALENIEASEKVGSRDMSLLRDAHDLYAGIIQLVRLCFDDNFDPKLAPADLSARLCHHAEVPDLTHLEDKLVKTQRDVLAIFNRALTMELNTE